MAILNTLDTISDTALEAVARHVKGLQEDHVIDARTASQDITLTALGAEDLGDFADEGWRWEIVGHDVWGVVIYNSDYGGYLAATDNQGETADALVEYAASMSPDALLAAASPRS